MANVYVRSGAAGAGTGADWANAYLTLAAAFAAKAAGDYFWLADDHAETQASAMTMTCPGTAASPCFILGVSDAGSVPPVAADLVTTPTITTTGSNAMGFGTSGHGYYRGVTFNMGTGSGSIVNTQGPAGTNIYDTCTFNIVATGSGSVINIGNTANAGYQTKWKDCTVSFADTGQGLSVLGGRFEWVGGSVAGATIPTNLFQAGTRTSSIILRGVDLSALGSGKTIFQANGNAGTCKLINCKLGASVTITGTPAAPGAMRVDLIGCSSAGNVRRDERYWYEGTQTTETTIVRTGGASDGTTAFSWKVVTTANAERISPFETLDGELWNDDTGSAKTLTVHTVTDNVTLTDAEIWLEVEYLGASGTPIVTVAADSNATILTTAANQATSTETWTTTGLGAPVKQKLEVTFTPQMDGPIRWRVKVAKVSTTVYICPKAELS